MKRGRVKLSVVFSMCWLAVLFITAIFSSQLAPQDPSAIDIEGVLLPPSAAHGLGTDPLGRDLLSRMIYGGRISLSVGLVAVAIAFVIGVGRAGVEHTQG